MFLKSVNETKARHKNSNYNSSNFVSSNNQLSINNSQKSSSGASRRTSIVRQTSKTTSEEIKRNVQKSRERSKNYERAVAARRRNSRAAWSVDHLRNSDGNRRKDSNCGSLDWSMAVDSEVQRLSLEGSIGVTPIERVSPKYTGKEGSIRNQSLGYNSVPISARKYQQNQIRRSEIYDGFSALSPNRRNNRIESTFQIEDGVKAVA